MGAAMSLSPSKLCAGPCGRELPLDAFYALKKGSPMRQSRCKDCDRERSRARQAPLRDDPKPGLRVVPVATEAEPEASEEEPEESFAPEGLCERVYRVYERRERERGDGRAATPYISAPLPEIVLEAERQANEVIALLRAGLSLRDSLAAALVDH